jgi:hypothetical protein
VVLRIVAERERSVKDGLDATSPVGAKDDLMVSLV